MTLKKLPLLITVSLLLSGCAVGAIGNIQESSSEEIKWPNSSQSEEIGSGSCKDSSESLEESSKSSENSSEPVSSFSSSEDAKYLFIFDLNGGYSPSYKGEVRTNDFPEDSFFFDCKKDGYNFRGWSYEGIQIFNEDGEMLAEPALKSTMTFVAMYADNAHLRISLSSPEAGEAKGEGYYPYNVEVPLSLRINKGYSFLGWYNEEGIPLSSSADYVYHLGNKDVVLEARFEYESYELSIASNNGDLGVVYINPTSSTRLTSYGESMSSSITYKNEVRVVASSKSSVRFLGWYDRNNELLSAEAIYVFDMPCSDYSLEAKWDRFAINYELNGGNNCPDNPSSVASGDELDLSPAHREGYSFLGWYDQKSDEMVTSVNGNSLSDISLYAKWKVISYAINYELNGGINNPSNPLTYTVEDSFVLEGPSKEGYSFEGWYLDPNFANPILQISMGTAGDLALYAKWDASLYTVTYVMDDGINDPSNPGSFNSEEKVVLLEPSKAGYSFEGWYSDSSFADRVYEIPAGTTESLTLYAKWELLHFNVSYDLAGGENNANPSSYTIFDDVALVSPSRDGYSFEGWFNGEEKIEVLGLGMVGDLSLTAHWKAISYSLSYVLNGGDNSEENPSSYSADDENIVLTSPSKEGYSFEGWYLDSSFEQEASSLPQGSFGDKTFYAKWAPLEHGFTVTTPDSNKGTVEITKGSGLTDEETSVLAKPEDGYLFKGWYSGETLLSKTKSYSFIMPNEDVFLTAIFASETEEREENRTKLGMTPVLSGDGKSLTYGLYPQSHVSDETIIASLEALESPSSNGWYLLNGEYYAKEEAKTSRTDRKFEDGTSIVPGTVYWYKCEPIVWDVLSSENGSYFLLSDILLDAHCYCTVSTGYSSNNYAHSELREWLNGEFHEKAFGFDPTFVDQVSVDNSTATTCMDGSGMKVNPNACEDTLDKVYLPSYMDYLNSDYGFSSNESRKCKTSDYAKATKGGSFNSNDSCGEYWTRSPSHLHPYYMGTIATDGHPDWDNDVTEMYDNLFVRPAITISFDF